MGYERKKWMPGDYIYPDNLNNIEDGIEELQEVKADKADVGAVVTETDRHTMDLQRVHEDLASLHEAIEETDDLVAMKADALDLATVAIELDTTRFDLAALDSRVDTKVDKIDLEAVAAEAAQTAAAVGRLQTEAQFIGNQIADAAAEAERHMGEIRALEGEMQLKAGANELADVASRIDSKADSVETSKELSVRGYQVDIAALEMEADRLNRRINAADNQIGGVLSELSDIRTSLSVKLPWPVTEGTNGQVLQTNGNGAVSWADPSVPSDEQIGEAVSDWLDDHPEATTTVTDGSITMEKLSDEVQEAVESGGRAEAVEAQLMATEQSLMIDRLQREDDDIRHHVETYSIMRPRLEAYASCFDGGDGAGFLFFTDPHNMSHWFGASPDSMLRDLKYIRNVFENTPARCVLCGGDWINVYHTLNEAKLICGRVPNLLRTEIGPDCYTVAGNHDLNIEGGIGGSLTEAQLDRLWRGRTPGYYALEVTEDCDCYMLHVGYSFQSVSAYQIAEAQWFAGQLRQNTKPHLFAVGHIIGLDDGTYFGGLLCSIMDAFNRREMIAVGNMTFDFTNAAGTFHFCMSGHYHIDTDDINHHIPVIFTDDFATTRAIDCCYADFANATLHLIRIGEGEDRTFPIIPNGGDTVNT